MEVSGQLHAQDALAAGTHWIGEGWLDPRDGLDAVEKRKIYPCWESNPGLQARSLSLYKIKNRNSGTALPLNQQVFRGCKKESNNRCQRTEVTSYEL
jgi:hypothetical protein